MLLSGMQQQMLIKIRFLRETTSTYTTLEWFITSVYSSVFDQVGLLSKSFITNITGIRFYSGVNQDMFA